MMLLDGAMGTALIDAGLSGALPERWLVERPGEVARVHAAHARAGAQAVLTCTFNLAAPRLRATGIAEPMDELARRAVTLARGAAPGLLVAGAVGPTLLAAASPAELRERYGEAFSALAAAGADLLWAESQSTPAEARAALAAGRATGVPTVVTFTFCHVGDASTTAAQQLECLEAIASEGALATGTNCDLPGTPVAALLRLAARRVAVPLVAKPSAGLPGQLLTPAAFAAWAVELARAGASWIGGCCGASAEHLAACVARLGAASRGGAPAS